MEIIEKEVEETMTRNQNFSIEIIEEGEMRKRLNAEREAILGEKRIEEKGWKSNKKNKEEEEGIKEEECQKRADLMMRLYLRCWLMTVSWFTK